MMADSAQQRTVFVPGARHNKKGRNEEERKKALEDDPRCSEVDRMKYFASCASGGLSSTKRCRILTLTGYGMQNDVS